MKLCVAGMWHLGCVTSACMSELGAIVTGIDDSVETIERLNHGSSPVFEPGLDELIKKGISEGRLSFTADMSAATKDAKYVWVCYDTPVDEEDNADVDYVLGKIYELVDIMNNEQGLIISSQLPVGSVRKVERYITEAGKKIPVMYSPENLRLGNAIKIFENPDRIIAGTRDENGRKFFEPLLSLIPSKVIWMRPESAEMSKHALNAFLASSISFINEIAAFCEAEGADAREVSAALKSEERIGPKAYLSPGGAFAGGTLARDVKYLIAKSDEQGIRADMLRGVLSSNIHHMDWIYQRTLDSLGSLYSKTIAVLGLTYKSGTDTLRRSRAVEFIRRFNAEGSQVKAYDENISSLPKDLTGIMRLTDSPEQAIRESDCVIIYSYSKKPTEGEGIILSIKNMHKPIVIDEGGKFIKELADDENIKYYTVGKG